MTSKESEAVASSRQKDVDSRNHDTNANINISVTRKASSPIKRIMPYDPILYGASIAYEFDEDARLQEQEYQRWMTMHMPNRRRERERSRLHDRYRNHDGDGDSYRHGNDDRYANSDHVDPKSKSLPFATSTLGERGNFNELLQTIPLETLIERRVYGPAHSDAINGEYDDIFYSPSDEVSHDDGSVNDAEDDGNGDGNGEGDWSTRISRKDSQKPVVTYKNREGDGEYTMRDNIIFMSSLEDDVATMDPEHSVKPQMIRGKELESSSVILDDPHLTVSEQLSGRLVKVGKDGSAAVRVADPLEITRIGDTSVDGESGVGLASHYKLRMEDPGEDVELDQNINTQLKNALSTFAKQFQLSCIANEHESFTSATVINNQNHPHCEVNESLSLFRHRHRETITRVSMLPGQLSRKYRTIIGKINTHISVNPKKNLNDEGRKKMPNGEDPNVVLRRGIDMLDNAMVISALKHDAEINSLVHNTANSIVNLGRSPFQTVFSRLCRIDAGEECRDQLKEHETLVQTLYNWGCDMNTTDCKKRWKGWAPIHYAASYGKFKRLEWIIRCGGDGIIHERTKIYGQTPLMIACEKGNFEKAYYLIQHGANFRQCDLRGFTVLHYGAASGNFLLVKFLVECGCVHDKLKECHDGESPLSISAKVNPRCYEYLGKVTIPRPLSLPFIHHIIGHPVRESLHISSTMKEKRVRKGRKKTK